MARDEKVYVFTSMLLIAFFWLGMLNNALYHHYPLPSFWVGTCVCGVVILGFLYFVLLRMRTTSKNIVQALDIAKTATLAGINLVFVGMYNLLMSCTPSAMHDYAINNLDRLLGFHLFPILHFMYFHPDFRLIVFILYFGTVIAYQAFPFFVTLTENRLHNTMVFFTAANIALMIGSAVFYFFPTMTSPAAIYPHQYFIPYQLNTLHAFQLEHAHRVPNFVFIGPIISFPSFHMIWITMMTYFLFSALKKWAILFGVIQVYVVLFTGWHYFVDIIAGFMIAYLAIKISEYLMEVDVGRDVSHATGA